MSKRLHYVSLRNMHHLMEGLSFRISECADVLDHALVKLNDSNGVPDRILEWNARGGGSWRPLTLPIEGRLVVEITERYGRERGRMVIANCIENKTEKEKAPLAIFSMQSLSLDIPMRLELPLRALIKGGQDFANTYCVYLHALVSDDGKDYVYYGITKRGWNARFMEHTKAAVADGSQRLFPKTFAALIDARAAEISGCPDQRPKLMGMITAACALGLTQDQALDTEEYLVDKYSLASKHPNGLNMIPGGREGIRVMHELTRRDAQSFVDTDAREAALDEHLARHPQLGVPKPGVAVAWNDAAYAEAVICGRNNRLSGDQVREIRYLAASGRTVSAIKQRIDTINDTQIRNVLSGRTYSRIR